MPSYSSFQLSEPPASSSTTSSSSSDDIPEPASAAAAAATKTVVTIPAKEAIQQEPAVKFPETREALDVTAKFFYLPPPPSSDGGDARGNNGEAGHHPLALDPAWIQESLDQLRVATGLSDIDTFIISIPGLVFDEDLSAGCATDAHSRTNGEVRFNPSEDDLDSQITRVWKAASQNKHIKSLGVSEFSLARLRWLLQKGQAETAAAAATETTSDPSTTHQQPQLQQDQKRKFTIGITSSSFRKPRVGQINLRESCDVPSDLVDFAKKQGIDLLVHSDCSGECDACDRPRGRKRAWRRRRRRIAGLSIFVVLTTSV